MSGTARWIMFGCGHRLKTDARYIQLRTPRCPQCRSRREAKPDRAWRKYLADVERAAAATRRRIAATVASRRRQDADLPLGAWPFTGVCL